MTYPPLPPRPTRRCRPDRAFTMVEMLVSITILAVIVLAATQLLNQAGLTINRSAARLDSDAEVRGIFNRMAADFAAMLKRPDVDYVMKRPTGDPDDYLRTVDAAVKGPLDANSKVVNDQMYFFSRSRGYYPKIGGVEIEQFKRSDLTLVGYRINSRFQLERCGRALAKDPSAGGDPLAPVAFLPLTITTYTSGNVTFDPLNKLLNDTRNTTSNQTGGSGGATGEPSFEVIGDQVFRLEYSFLFKPGVLRNFSGSSNPNDLDRRSASLTAYPGTDLDTTGKYKDSFPAAAPLNGLRHVSAIVVTLATLDNRSRGIMINPPARFADLSKAVVALGNPTQLETNAGTAKVPDRNTVATQWQRILDDAAGFRTSSQLLPAAANNVRLYERVFPLQSAD